MKSRKLALFIAISAVFHLTFLWLGANRPEALSPSFDSVTLVPLREVDPSSEDASEQSRPVVETEAAGEKELPTGDWAYGERTQSVQKQTRAFGVGRFQPGAPNGSTTDASGGGSPGSQPGARPDSLSLRDLGLGAQAARAMAVASSDDHLIGIERASRTALSTREHQFFSFYKRAEEILRLEWTPEVEARALTAASKGLLPAGRDLTTRVIVKLTPDGRVGAIMLLRSSGVAFVDEAARVAFERAAPFRNVPKAMVEADGYARVRWEFILTGTGSRGVRLVDGTQNDPSRRVD